MLEIIEKKNWNLYRRKLTEPLLLIVYDGISIIEKQFKKKARPKTNGWFEKGINKKNFLKLKYKF